MKTAIFPGSFDPITNGHIDIIEKSSKIFDKVIVAVAVNINKKSFIPTNDKINLIKKSVKHLENVFVASYDGLTVNYAKQNSIDVIIRGIRNNKDFEYEMEMAQFNNSINKEIDTIFFPTKPEHLYISSSSVRELYTHKTNIENYVPKCVVEYLNSKRDVLQ